MGKLPLGKLSLGKKYIWEVVEWEIAHLGSCHLGKYPWEVALGKRPVGKYLSSNFAGLRIIAVVVIIIMQDFNQEISFPQK